MAAAAMMLFSCAKENGTVTPSSEDGFTYTFKIATDGTKATLNDDATAYKWEDDDAINVYSSSSVKGSVTSAGVATATFSTALSAGDKVYATYPYSESNTSTDAVTFSIPTEQDGSTIKDAMPMYSDALEVDAGTDVSGTFQMHNLGAVLKFKVYGASHAEETVTSITYTADGIAGNFTATNITSSPALTGGDANAVKATASNVAVGADSDGAGIVYMVVAPAAASTTGTIAVETSAATYTATLPSALSMSANDLVTVPLNLDNSAFTTEGGSTEEYFKFADSNVGKIFWNYTKDDSYPFQEGMKYEDGTYYMKYSFAKSVDLGSDDYSTIFSSISFSSEPKKTDITSFDEYQYFTGTTSLPAESFNYWKNLKSITLPSSLTSIGSNAFYFCSSLASPIVIPSGVTKIEDYVFLLCSGIPSITIPEGVTSIGAYVFTGCSSLTSIEIPSTVTSIGAYAFQGCSKITSMTIPEGVSVIWHKTFFNCKALESLTFKGKIEKWGASVFDYYEDDKDQSDSGITQKITLTIASDQDKFKYYNDTDIELEYADEYESYSASFNVGDSGTLTYVDEEDDEETLYTFKEIKN